MTHAVKTTLRSLAYHSGLLGLVHRLRNRQTLTVFMFHRVLPADSMAYKHAEREFTFSVAGFARCLDFIDKHYTVVSQGDIQAHLECGKPLPPRAGLITFDDGWRDTAVYAIPELKKRHLPALLFLATEVLDLTTDRWWQDMLVEALAQTNTLEQLEQSLGICAKAAISTNERRRRITGTLAALEDMQRHALLTPFVAAPPMGRQMLTTQELADFSPDMAIAGHGHSHGPLTHHPNSAADLAASKAKLIAIGADDSAMSFPHGAVDAATLAQAQRTGFSLCYSSAAGLVDTTTEIQPEKPLGRIHIPENEWTCEGGIISFPRMASFLFFRPIAP